MPHAKAVIPFTLDEHKPMDLVRAVIAGFRPPLNNDLQAWLRDLSSLVDHNGVCLNEHDMHLVAECLERGKQLMSWKFFRGQLGEVEVSAQQGLLDCNKCYGYTTGRLHTTRIVIDPCPYVLYCPNSQRVAATLLHELSHALLMKYSCENQFCDGEDCKSRHFFETKVGGHGTAWVQLAARIELESMWYFGIRLDLGVEKHIPALSGPMESDTVSTLESYYHQQTWNQQNLVVRMLERVRKPYDACIALASGSYVRRPYRRSVDVLSRHDSESYYALPRLGPRKSL